MLVGFLSRGSAWHAGARGCSPEPRASGSAHATPRGEFQHSRLVRKLGLLEMEWNCNCSGLDAGLIREEPRY